MAIAKTIARLDPRGEERDILRSRWPNDPTAPLVLRAATNPTTLAANPPLGPSLVANLIATIGPTGAGARLLQAGLQVGCRSARSALTSGGPRRLREVPDVANAQERFR